MALAKHNLAAAVIDLETRSICSLLLNSIARLPVLGARTGTYCTMYTILALMRRRPQGIIMGVHGASDPVSHKPPPPTLPSSPPPANKDTGVDGEGPYEPLGQGGLGRYAAYAARAARTFAKVSRYSAYASDVGEAFRPVAHPNIVNASYAIAFGYVGLDVAYNGHRANKEGRSVPRAVAHAAMFQGLASLAAPFAIIHTQVSLTTKLCKHFGKFQKWGPTVSGLALIPFLPSLVDEPIEHLIDNAFETYWPEEGSKTKHD